MRHGLIPNDQDAHSSCNVFTGELSWTKPPPQTWAIQRPQLCSHGELAGSLPPPRHSFSTSATQKSHFLSRNTIAPTGSHRLSHFCAPPTRRARLRAHKHKAAILARNQVLPGTFCCHRAGAGARYPVPGCSPKHSVWATAWVTVALPQKNRHRNAAEQGLKLVQGLTLDKTVKNRNSPSGFGIKKIILPSRRNAWVFLWLRTDVPGWTQSCEKNMGPNGKLCGSKAVHRSRNFKPVLFINLLSLIVNKLLPVPVILREYSFKKS